MLPQSLKEPLQLQLQRTKFTHERDLSLALGAAYLLYALSRKDPNANRHWIWQYVFPADKLCRDPRDGMIRRHRVHEATLQRVMQEAAPVIVIPRRVCLHSLNLCRQHSEVLGITAECLRLEIRRSLDF